MMRLPRSVSSSALVLGSVLGLTMTQGGTAEAGHGHFSGSVRFSGGFRGGIRSGASVRFARPAIRPFHRPRVWVGGRWWWNYSWWPRPYYYYYYYPESVPSYYGGTYYPVQPGVSAPGAVAVPPRRASLPTFGFGVFAGGTAVNGAHDASEVGLLARLRLTPGLLLEGELAKDSFSGEVSTCPANGAPCTLIALNGDRVDRRVGGSLIWELGAHNSFAPYLLAGGGVQQAKVTSGDFFGSDFTTTQDYGEIGVGLRWALSRSLHLTADIRAGRRQTIDSNQTVTPVARAINPPSGGPGNDTEDYTRARFAAVVNF